MGSKPAYPRSYFTNRPADRTHNFVITSCCAVGVYSGPDRKAQQADKAWKPGLNNTDKYEAKIDRTAGTWSPSGGDLISSSYQHYLRPYSLGKNNKYTPLTPSDPAVLLTISTRTAGNFGLPEMLSGLNCAYRQATISPVQSAAEQQIRSLPSQERTVQFSILSVRL